MRARFFTVDVFTDRLFGGNQLAVFPDASGILPHLMPLIAAEFNYSETTFVLPAESPGHTARVRIFTPATELPFAGHPTVGTAHVLASIGAAPLTGDETRLVLEEQVGPVPVTVTSRDGVPVFAELTAARPPEPGPPAPPPVELAAMLSLTPADLAGPDLPAETHSCGVPFLFVALRGREAVGRAAVNAEVFRQVMAAHPSGMVMVFAPDPEHPGHDIRARMFAPGQNIAEDPATGSAVAALAGYLAPRAARSSGTLRWLVEQGFEMGRPSLLRLEADLEESRITAVRVGGRSVMVSEGLMQLPDN